MAFEQVRLDEKGTYGAFDPQANKAIAFPTEGDFRSFFGADTRIDPLARLANFDTAGILGSANKILDVTQIAPQSSLAITNPVPGPDVAGATVAGAKAGAKSIDQYIAELTVPPTETEKKVEDLTTDISGLLEGTKGKFQSQLEEEEKAGIPMLKKRLADINASILSRTAAYDYTHQKVEDQAIPMSLIIGQQAQVRKAQASEIGLLQAQALGLQGQVQAATETANRAVDLKYSAKEDEIRIKLEQLRLLEPKLSKEEKIRSEALRRKYEDEQTAIQDKKTQQKEAINYGIDHNVQTPFYMRGGTVYRTVDGKAYSTEEEFFADGGKRDFSNAPQVGLQPTIFETREDKLTGHTIRYGFDDLGNLLTKVDLSTGRAIDTKVAPATTAPKTTPTGTPPKNTAPVLNNYNGTATQKRDVANARLSDNAAANYFLKTPKEFRDLWHRNVAPLNGQSFSYNDVVQNYQSWYDMKQKETADKKKKDSGLSDEEFLKQLEKLGR